MGYLFKNVCYPTQDMARTMSCSEQTFTYTDGGGTIYTRECATPPSAASMSICTRKDGAACKTTTQPWPTYPTCTFDGGTTFAHDWFGAALILLALIWGGKQTIKLFENHHDRD